MKIIPAIDLKDGKCVQLIGGDFSNEKIRLDDPVRVAQFWLDAGYDQLHIVDLDAAAGVGSNGDIVDEILSLSPGKFQVGGGIREERRIAELVERGASRVVIGSRAVNDSHWIEEIVSKFPDQIVVAADARRKKVQTNGWKQESGIGVADFVRTLIGLPLAAILVTSIENEGMAQGCDLALYQELVEITRTRLIASGGIVDEDIGLLEKLGINEAVVGMSLYLDNLSDLKEKMNRD